MNAGGTNQNHLKERVPLSDFRNKYRLNQNPLCQPGADGEARVADQTDDVGLAGEQLDDLVFAEADFPQTRLTSGGAHSFLIRTAKPARTRFNGQRAHWSLASLFFMTS